MEKFINSKELIFYENNYFSSKLKVSEKKNNYKVILEKRLFNFSVDVIKYVLTLLFVPEEANQSTGN